MLQHKLYRVSSVDVVPRLRAACISIPGTGRQLSLSQNAQTASEAYPVDIALNRAGREAVQSVFEMSHVFMAWRSTDLVPPHILPQSLDCLR